MSMQSAGGGFLTSHGVVVRRFALFVLAMWVVLNAASLPVYLSAGTESLASSLTLPVGILLPFGGQALPDGFFTFAYRLFWPVLAVLVWKLSSGDWRARSGPAGAAIATVLTLLSIVSVNVVENAAAFDVSPIVALKGILPLCVSVGFTLVMAGIAASFVVSWIHSGLQRVVPRARNDG